MIFDRNFSIKTKDKVAKLVGGTTLSLFIVRPFKNFQASRNQITWLAETNSFWAKSSFLIQEKKLLFWHELAKISPRNLRGLERL